MKQLLLIAFLAIVFSGSALSQDKPLIFRHYDVSKGLDQPFPYHIIQDKSGFVWIGGENGLWRYSGGEFTQYSHNVDDTTSLPYDFVWVLLEDSKGYIWAGTFGGGLARYDPILGNFITYNAELPAGKNLSNNLIRGLAEDSKGNIWIGTNQGLNKLNPNDGSIQHFGVEDGLLSATVRSCELSQDGSKMYIATGNGLNILDLANETFTGIDINTSPKISHRYIYDIHQLSNGKILIATGGGLELYDEKKQSIYSFPVNEKDPFSLNHPVVFSITTDKLNPDKVWLGTMNGVSTYSVSTGKIETISTNSDGVKKLSGNNIYCINTDDTGGIWIAVNNVGVFHYHPGFQKFEKISFLPENTDKYLSRITRMLEISKNEYLITTYSGLVHWDKKTNIFQRYRFDQGDQNSINRMTDITRIDENTFWISTWGHFIYEWNHNTRSLKPLKSKNPAIKANFSLRILKDKKGRTWLGSSESGLLLWNDQLKEFETTLLGTDQEPNILNDEYVKYIFEDSNGRIWVGTQGGLNLLNEIDGTFFKFTSQKWNPNSLSSNTINHISESKNGELWISTELGLSHFSVSDSTFTNYFKSSGLPSNVISSTQKDDDGNLWIATSSGVAKMDPQGNISNFDQSDGINETYFIFGSSYIDANGQVFFGNSTELVHFDPKSLPLNSNHPMVYLTGLKLNDQEISPNTKNGILKKSIQHTEEIVLNKDHFLITIGFDAINLIDGEKNQYQFLLENHDTEWRDASNIKQVTFSGLTQGKYKLRVRAINNDNLMSQNEATLGIKILPYWYESYQFRILFSLAITILAGLIVYIKFKNVKNQNAKLELLVQARTSEVLIQKEEIETQNEKLSSRNDRIELLLKELNHRVKNNLQLISSILNLQSRTIKNEDARNALKEGKLRMQALSLLHQKLYMDEKHTEVDCKAYIEELLEHLSMAFKSNYRNISFDLDIDQFNLNLDKSVPLGLILNELITNSLKHAKREDLVIELVAKNLTDTISIGMKDNGPGMKAELFETSQSFGITMILALVDQINGTLKLNPENGAFFNLEFAKT